MSRLEARTLSDKSIAVKARTYVLACGGLEATRLLLASPDSHGSAVGDHSGKLGRWYMGHLEGSIANIRFKTAAHDTIFGYERDTDGVYVRRRISVHEDAQLRDQLPNVVGWLANPSLPDASHDDGALSLAYLILASPLGAIFSPPAQRAAMTGERVPGVPVWPSKAAALSGSICATSSATLVAPSGLPWISATSASSLKAVALPDFSSNEGIMCTRCSSTVSTCPRVRAVCF